MVRLRNEGHSRWISSRRICNAWSIWNTGEEFTRPYDVPLLDEFHGVRREKTWRFEPRTDLCFFPRPWCPRKVPKLHLQREIRILPRPCKCLWSIQLLRRAAFLTRVRRSRRQKVRRDQLGWSRFLGPMDIWCQRPGDNIRILIRWRTSQTILTVMRSKQIYPPWFWRFQDGLEERCLIHSSNWLQNLLTRRRWWLGRLWKRRSSLHNCNEWGFK